MDKFEQKEMKKISPIKSTWYDWLINYFPELIRKRVGCFKDITIIIFKTNIPKQTGRMGEERSYTNQKKITLKSLLSQKRTKKDGIIRDIQTLFEKKKKI